MSWWLDKFIDKERLKLAKARTQVVLGHPFFGSLLLRQRIRPSNRVQTIATDGSALMFNREFIKAASSAELQYVCARLALASGLQHHLRMEGREKDRWNVASVMTTNSVLQRAGFSIPEGAPIGDRWQTVEQVYADLPESPDTGEGQGDSVPQGGSGSQGGGGGQGEGDQASGDGGGGQSDQQENQDDQQRPEGGDGQGDQEQDKGDDNEEQQPEQEPEKPQEETKPEIPDYNGGGAVVDPQLTGADREHSKNELKAALRGAERNDPTLGVGEETGNELRELRAILEPKADWKELLRRWFNQVQSYDYSWARPNRRFVAQGIYLPSSVPSDLDGLGSMVILIDASGSMPRDRLNEALSELASITEELEPEKIHVIVHDSSIDEYLELERGDDLNDLDVNAGGGTRIASSAEKVAEIANDEEVACAVWFTDLLFEQGDVAEAHKAWPEEVPLLWIDYCAKSYSNDEDVMRRFRPYGSDGFPFGDEIVSTEDD